MPPSLNSLCRGIRSASSRSCHASAGCTSRFFSTSTQNGDNPSGGESGNSSATVDPDKLRMQMWGGDITSSIYMPNAKTPNSSSSSASTNVDGQASTPLHSSPLSQESLNSSENSSNSNNSQNNTNANAATATGTATPGTTTAPASPPASPPDHSKVKPPPLPPPPPLWTKTLQKQDDVAIKEMQRQAWRNHMAGQMMKPAGYHFGKYKHLGGDWMLLICMAPGLFLFFYAFDVKVRRGENLFQGENVLTAAEKELRRAEAGTKRREEREKRLKEEFQKKYRGEWVKEYKFTGGLRPYAVERLEEVKLDEVSSGKLEGVVPDYARSGVPAGEEEALGKGEIPLILPGSNDHHDLTASCTLARQALDGATALVKPGNTPHMVSKYVYEFLVDGNNKPVAADAGDANRSIDNVDDNINNDSLSYPSVLNYHSFPHAACVSVNEVICHGIADSRPFEEGDVVGIDLGAFCRGFHGVVGETVVVSSSNAAGGAEQESESDDNQRLVTGARACLERAISVCGPGVSYSEIGNAISKTAAEFDLSVVKSYCSHGVGKHLHQLPMILNYTETSDTSSSMSENDPEPPSLAESVTQSMQPGHVFTIEPKLNLGSCEDQVWGDGWTVVTKDGMKSAHFKETILITEHGVEVLTRRSGEGRLG